jgi:uncharacterized protein (TIGR03435 family)
MPPWVDVKIASDPFGVGEVASFLPTHVSRRITAQSCVFTVHPWPSITTEELASRLVRFAEAPVVDKTGLTGKYSVTIETWKNADVPGGTVFDAVEKLGLKLEARKVTVETVVVDQVSKTPTAN